MNDLATILHEPYALIEEFLPRMQDAVDRPHIEGLWTLIRRDFRAAFEGSEFDDEVPDALFDLMVAFAVIEPRITP